MPVPVPLAFTPAGHRVGTAVTKIGGQPVWLEQPAWPLSRSSGEPMQFLGQFALSGGRLAYLFMADSEEGFVDGTWEPDAGENALLVQPGGRVPDFVTVRRQAQGPTAGPDHVPDPPGAGWPGAVMPVELREGPAALPMFVGRVPDGEGNVRVVSAWEPGEGRIPDVTASADAVASLRREHAEARLQFFGGPGIPPRWLQDEDEDPDEDWSLLVQLAVDRLPFWVNFGDGGVGYAFLSPDGLEGRFLWQSPEDEETW
ncbi:hypothetical protein [Streptomyces atratus]|uniref:hypothetical protein n=2 Tax=Streptomyces atratus TaxID=1893 RepID=UPI00225BD844|nr:hypothetical protein [Streptomyces atratus]MCX5344924.1 hypothetical protein [Streptomyces atratus]